jgi:hypothetical protein
MSAEVQMTEAVPKTKRAYTARTVSERVLRLLDEAAELVRKGCVEASTGVGTERAVKKSVAQAATQVGIKTRNALTQAGLDPKTSRIATEAAVRASKEALSPLLRNATAVVSDHTGPKGKTRKVAFKSPTPTAAAAAAPVANTLAAPAEEAVAAVKTKQSSCPGGPAAFNKFLKEKRAEVQTRLGPQATYPEVRAEIARMWKDSCPPKLPKPPKAPTQTRKTRQPKTAKVPIASSVTVPAVNQGTSPPPFSPMTLERGGTSQASPLTPGVANEDRTKSL